LFFMVQHTIRKFTFQVSSLTYPILLGFSLKKICYCCLAYRLDNRLGHWELEIFIFSVSSVHLHCESHPNHSNLFPNQIVLPFLCTLAKSEICTDSDLCSVLEYQSLQKKLHLDGTYLAFQMTFLTV